jgi:hypothetical protein
MQYSASIDDFARIMKDGNNGGYANNWLVADRKTNEIADLELGLKNVTLERSKDGYFVGSNFPVNPKLAREETRYNLRDKRLSANARHVRWEQLMAEYKGRIDVALAERFLADHYDTYEKKDDPNERTLCGHVDLSPRGSKNWQPPYGPAGAVQNKVADATMAEHMTLAAAAGHSCGINFNAAEHLRTPGRSLPSRNSCWRVERIGWAKRANAPACRRPIAATGTFRPAQGFTAEAAFPSPTNP